MENPDETARIESAAAFIRNKEFRKAQDILVSIIQKNPRSEQAWFLLSYAVSDPKIKITSLQKVIQINPNNYRAEVRIKKLQGLKPAQKSDEEVNILQVSAALPEKKRRLPWYAFPVVVVILLLIAFIGVVKILPTFSPVKEEIQSALIEPSPAETTSAPAPETQSPQSTASDTPVLQPTITPTTEVKTPLPERNLDIPQGSLAQQMDNIQNQVATIRELGILKDNSRYLIPDTGVYSIISRIFREYKTREEIRRQAIALQSLGLIDPNYDLYSHMLDSLDEGLGGFYIPWTDELFVVGEEFSPVEKLVYAHEYVHALTDQHFQLENIGVYPLCNFEADTCSAVTALVEGDATYLMYRWLEAYASDEDIALIQEAQYAPVDEVITSSDFPPPYVIRDVEFKYEDGQAFVEYLFDKGGWNLVDRAYRDLPQTTEQILHPEKYINKELPLSVKLESLDNVLDDTWELIVSGTLGQLMTEMVLGHNENYLMQIEHTQAITAAAGWGGDQYQVYYQGRTNQTLLVAMWEWDTMLDRDQFFEALFDYLNLKYVGKQAQESEETCWVKINDHYSCIYKWNKRTLWVTAPSRSMISQILTKYPNFE